MKKKLISMVSLVSLLLTMLPAVAFAGEGGVQPGDIVTADKLKAGDEIVKGLGEYQYGTDPSSSAVQDISWIILDPAKTNMGTAGMFLISKNLLDVCHFSSESQDYQVSGAKAWCDAFYSGSLEMVDENLGNAIISTSKSDVAYTLKEHQHNVRASANILNGDRVFLPSAQEVDNDYIWNGADGNAGRAARGGGVSDSVYWLRSPFETTVYGVADVGGEGSLSIAHRDQDASVRPALNLNTESLRFRAVSEGKYELVGTVKVNFDTQGGSAVETQTIVKGDKAAEPATPTKKGFIFKGWYDAKEGGSKVDFADKTFSEDTTLYAQWKAAPAPAPTPDPENPQGGNNVNTGDSNNIMPWIVLLLTGGIGTTFVIRRRHNMSE